MKEKAHKVRGRKGVYEFVETSCFTDELPLGKGPVVHPVVRDIFARLALKPVEEALKFTFKDALSAKRFKYMLNHYREVRKLNVHVGCVDTTVYAYNKPVDDTGTKEAK